MRRPRDLFATLALVLPASASAAPWWYVAHDEGRAVFIDAKSIQHRKSTIAFSSKDVIREHDNPVAMAVKFLQADCAKRQIGWAGVQQFGYDEAVIDTSTRRKAGMTNAIDPLDDAALDFVCADDASRAAGGFFPISIDDAAFTEALLSDASNSLTPRALHDKMAAAPTTVVVRSTAPAPATFGQTQTVAIGQPMVPPRDYSKGPQVPNPADYSSDEVGRIYDVAYQGIKDGQLQFEIRGYSIDDLVHPGSGQMQAADPRERPVLIKDLVITIKAATAERITYSIAIQK
ncbi:hypothetical protein [Sphingomonas endolithica]|uniref:hypothetical protein n=1 Tax=Sphingomonas endolithica TaxID=2972485 RepID=UPI0021AF670B|nr:hypothetical protein [Sphingomonas sp. ZFBP2030]